LSSSPAIPQKCDFSTKEPVKSQFNASLELHDNSRAAASSNLYREEEAISISDEYIPFQGHFLLYFAGHNQTLPL
jgi:hypothetical protein